MAWLTFESHWWPLSWQIQFLDVSLCSWWLASECVDYLEWHSITIFWDRSGCGCGFRYGNCGCVGSRYWSYHRCCDRSQRVCYPRRCQCVSFSCSRILLRLSARSAHKSWSSRQRMFASDWGRGNMYGVVRHSFLLVQAGSACQWAPTRVK